MKNSNLLRVTVRSAACPGLAANSRLAAALASTALLGAVLAGCGEDPILLAEIIASGQQPRASEPAQPTTVPASDEPPPEPATPEVSPPEPEAPPSEPESGNPLEAPALEILIRYCGECHDTMPEQGEGDFSFVGDLDLLLASGQIVAGDRDASRVYIRMVSGTMPPALPGANGPTVEEIELVGSFIDSLAYDRSGSY